MSRYAPAIAIPAAHDGTQRDVSVVLGKLLIRLSREEPQADEKIERAASRANTAYVGAFWQIAHEQSLGKVRDVEGAVLGGVLIQRGVFLDEPADRCVALSISWQVRPIEW